MLKLWNVEKGTFARDLLSDVTGGIWQVRFDYKDVSQLFKELLMKMKVKRLLRF